MKINFMVIALPRSATTWAANWLTTDNTICLHDALAYSTLNELEDKNQNNNKKVYGLSDTVLCLNAAQLNKHPAKKVILHRDINEINESLNELFLPPISEEALKLLDDIQGLHVHYQELFNNPEPIWHHLLGDVFPVFDAERHKLLVEMQVQPEFAKLAPVNKEAIMRYFSEDKE